MFATQQYLEAIDAGRKRFREDGDLAIGTAGFGEHRNKRFQSSLPLRNSNRMPQQYLSQTIMPLNASPAEAGPRHTVDICTPATMKNSANEAAPAMDLINTVQSTLSGSGHDGSAGVLGSKNDGSIGRMPTSIPPSFAAQVKGPNAGWAPLPVATVPNGIVNLGHHVTGFSQDKCVPRVMNASDTEWHVLQDHRPLPSPISEVGTSGINGQARTSTGTTVDHDGCLVAQSQFPAGFLCSSSCQPSPTHGMEHPNALIDAEICSKLAHNSESHADPRSPSPGRKGHQRSKHTINSWTWQPGMKKSFSIGYRNDCEKCQLKVPGHFNHIVIS
ncbi:hypothetical protein E4U55_004670 [Claviceps digitariae]|nr:hypothetical protein E4U55_004670 [Claviceps digitariae]